MYTAPSKIKELRDNGWKVKVRVERIVGETNPETPPEDYDRRAKHERKSGETISPKGGTTIVTLIPPPGSGDGEIVGRAYCHTVKDNFNKRVGLEIALGRAIKELSL